MPIRRTCRWLLVIPLLLFSVVSVSNAQAATGTTPYVGIRKHTTSASFSGTRVGVVVGTRDGRADVRLGSSGLMTGNNTTLYGNPRSYWYGRLTSPVYSAARPFDTAIASWNASTPAGTWMEVQLRAYRSGDNHWTKFYNLGIWASGTGTIKRHSVAGQGNADGYVATDTLLLYGQPRYTRYQYRLTLFTIDPRVTPSVRLLSVMTSNSYKQPLGLRVTSDRQAWGRDLAVPERSQMVYPNGGDVWCSPTSVSMALAYWGRSVTVPTAAAGTYDYVYKGNGNWPFSTAYAATYRLDAYITRMGSISQLEEWISAGIPVVISIGWGSEELSGAPFRTSSGHVIVVRGFTRDGQVIVNDPGASRNEWARRVYKRAELERVWLKYSGGTSYIMYPRGRAVPTDKRYGSW